MDIIKRRKYPISIRVIYSLTLFFICYVVLVRPVRVYINQNYVAPFYRSLDQTENSLVTTTARRINIQPDGYNSPRGFGIPFGGYFWLPFSLLIATRQKWPAIGLVGYHIFLGILPPYFAFLFIKQFAWAGVGLEVNETLFQGVFLISVFWGVKTILDQYKKEKNI
jgi:hypothetical protein